MEHKASFKLIVLLLAFSLVFTYAVNIAVPSSRSLKSISASLSAQDLQDQMAEGKFHEKDESSYVVGRMYLEINDYASPGANTNHDPKPPGTG